MKKLAKIAARLMGQPMFKLLAKAREREKAGQIIYHFEIGDSDFGSHPHIREATKQALDQDCTRYVNSAGILELRSAIAEHIRETLGFRPDLDQIVVITANAVIDFVVRCVVDPGEEVIFPDPGFPTYMAVASYTGVRKVPVPLREKDGFHVHPDEIARRVTDKTRLLIINTPQNPTGAVLGKEEMDEIYRIAKKNDIFILSDEVYSRVIYDREHYSPGVIDRCRERTIILNGFTKGYLMSGWRLGYAVGPKAVIEKMTMLFETIYSCTPPFIQHAGVAALRGDQRPIEKRILEFRFLRDLIVEELNNIPGISCCVPEGAYYVFPNIRDTGMSSEVFADFVLEKAGVALLPGTCFGEHGEGYARICFTRKPEAIKEACAKMRASLSENPPKGQRSGDQGGEHAGSRLYC